LRQGSPCDRDHRVLCADALVRESYLRLLGDVPAQMVFTDPPWNIPIAGHVSGLGAVKHDDFSMGCGEMSAAEFEAFPFRTVLSTQHGRNTAFRYLFCVGDCLPRPRRA
jgi:hypothetical protein